jgi:hypothetical protein
MISRRPRGAWLALGLLIRLVSSAHGRADDLSPEDRGYFEAKVRPILVARCYECHSAGAKTLRGGLRLDSREGWRRGGDSGPAVEPGAPDESLLIQAVRYDDPVLKMPPKGRLPDEDVATLTEWVRRGAPDPRVEAAASPASKPARVIDIEEGRKHWAFQPLASVEPPDVNDVEWCRTSVDRFILARLEERGLTPMPEADRRVLIRRAAFDLTGLPPTPEEVEAFVHDPAPDAFDRLVDRLLDSQHYGERWARHWLDLARFAESHGFEHDYDRPTAYTYRDFVIEALNRELPYDTFVQWQLAGDELAPDDHLALKATGFLGAGTHSTQITKNQVEKERYDELDDMVNTAGTAFLGLTIGCARCHDHKFDPIRSRDYYRFVANFTTTVRSEVNLVPDAATLAKAQARYEAEHRPYLDALARFEAEELPGRLARWEETRDRSPSTQPRWGVLEPSKLESKGGAAFTRLADGSYKVSGPNAEFDVYTLNAACDLAEITAIRIEAFADESLPHGGPGRAPNGNFALTDVRLEVGPRYGIGMTLVPRLVNAKASFEQPGLPVASAIDDDPKSGWAVDPAFGADHAAVFEIGQVLRTDSGCTLRFTLKFENNAGHNIGRLRLSVTDSPRPVGLDDDGVPAAIRPILTTSEGERTREQRDALLAWYASVDPSWQALRQAIDDHARTAPKPEGEKALVCTEGLPAIRLHTQGDDFLPVTHYLRRGDPNQKEGEAEPGFLPVLMTASDGEARWREAPPDDWRTSYRRRALARWMTDPEHGAGHLLARVIVNRLWQHHFGRGLVATPSDFGAQGATPSHPELLDWLATRLIEGGWRLKPIHELLMTSAAYRQGSSIDPAKAAVDVENVLVWRQRRRRLEAEPIRDAMLSVSGLLDPRMFGPGSLDERMRRRSIYFTVKRSQLVRFLSLFDAPDALVPIAERSSTTVAPQALLLLNSPVVREWAAAFAARVRPGEGESRDDAINRAYRLALVRDPRPDEFAAARSFLDAQAAAYRAAGRTDEEAAALTDFCQALFGLSEFLYIE